MSTRISRVAFPALLALGACTQPKAVTVQEEGKGAEHGIACQIGDKTTFANVCAVDRIGTILVVRQPDGGFRRLAITEGGTGVVAADGAERAVVTITGDKQIEVAIGGNRYRLPATLKGMSAPTP